MKVKDANGIDQTISGDEGVKRLLDSRPYLVKSNHRSGSGTTGNSAGNDSNMGTDSDLSTLNEEYKKAFYSGDLKKSREIRIKIQSKMAARQAGV